MSYFDLPGETRQQLPDFPKLAQSMLLIETQKYCQINSQDKLHPNHNFSSLHEDYELSLELKIEKPQTQAISSSTTIKKKKGGCTCKKTKCLKMYC